MGNCALPKSKDDTSFINSKIHTVLKPSCFKKLNRIGRGGFSLVWKVKNKNDSNILAMKEMSKARVVFKKCVKSVLNEQRILSILKHPLLVNMHYAFQTPETLYLVMDYMEGGDLRYAIGNNGAFSEPEVKFFICCCLSAIELSLIHI